MLDALGRPLLRRGTVLTEDSIGALRERDVCAVHVADGMADDVPRRDMVSVALRASAQRHLSTVFAGLDAAEREAVERPAHLGFELARRRLLLAEIAAVADVYSALTSDRPYRSAMGTTRPPRPSAPPRRR